SPNLSRSTPPLELAAGELQSITGEFPTTVRFAGTSATFSLLATPATELPFAAGAREQSRWPRPPRPALLCLYGALAPPIRRFWST
ncbi:hypothetical protein E2562_031532, partial [Oryza meyeriana var. granulata]